MCKTTIKEKNWSFKNAYEISRQIVDWVRSWQVKRRINVISKVQLCGTQLLVFWFSLFRRQSSGYRPNLIICRVLLCFRHNRMPLRYLQYNIGPVCRIQLIYLQYNGTSIILANEWGVWGYPGFGAALWVIYRESFDVFFCAHCLVFHLLETFGCYLGLCQLELCFFLDLKLSL